MILASHSFLAQTIPTNSSRQLVAKQLNGRHVANSLGPKNLFSTSIDFVSVVPNSASMKFRNGFHQIFGDEVEIQSALIANGVGLVDLLPLALGKV